MLPLFHRPRMTPHYEADASIVLHEGDALEFVKTIPDASVQLVVTSPPYNIGKAYETRQALDAYLSEQVSLIVELKRILKPTGSVCWQVGNYIQDGQVYPLDMHYYPLFLQAGFQLRNRIIWYFRHGLHAQKRLSGRYETLLWLTKSDLYSFHLDAVRVPSKYPGKRHFKGDKQGQLSGNPLGKNPGDVWDFVAQAWDEELWDIPNVKANHPEKTAHPCQYPIELVERCVLAFTQAEDTVFDPYMGVGSSLIGALKHQRRAVGCDRDGDYVQAARQRITDFYAGKLKIRPLGKPVHEPTGREKIAQRPLKLEVGS